MNVTYKQGHDKLDFKATFDTGGYIKFVVTRSGEKLTVAGASGKEGTAQLNIISHFMKFRDKELNSERIARLKDICEVSNSVKQVCDKIIEQNPK